MTLPLRKKADFKVKLDTPKENTFTSTIRNKLMGVDKKKTIKL